MPNVQQNNQVKRNGHKNRADINRDLPKAKARDDLKEAFAGDQNLSSEHLNARNTHLKSRARQASKSKTPKR